MTAAIGAVSSTAMFAMRQTGSTSGAQRAGGPPKGGPDPTTMLTPVEEKLGVSVDDLKNQLASGSTLTSLAESAGVSHEDLISAITQGIDNDRGARPVGEVAPTGQVFDIEALAEAIAAGPPAPATPSVSGVRPAHGTNQADGQLVEQLSASLGMDTADVIEALIGGTSLSDLVAQQGVSMSSVLNSLGEGMLVNTTM